MGYNIENDDFPAGNRIVKAMLRNRVLTLAEGEEEVQVPATVEELAELELEKEVAKRKEKIPM